MKLLAILIACSLFFGCASSTTVTKQQAQTNQSEVVADEVTEDQEAYKEKLIEILARLDPGPLSREEYRSLTQHPYSREPFLEDVIANQMYFNGFRTGFATRTWQPGQLILQGNISGSMADAAEDAGFSAGITGDLSQLTNTERQEVNEWKRKLEEVSMWPSLSNFESKMEMELQLLRQLDELNH